MKEDLKALFLAVAAAVSIFGLAGCSMALGSAPATVSETTAQQTEFKTAAAKKCSTRRGFRGRNQDWRKVRMQKRPLSPC